jgi:uncharacterized membrane protein
VKSIRAVLGVISLALLSIVTLNILVCEFGATDISGAGAATPLGLLVSVLVVVLHEDLLLRRAADDPVAGQR